MLTSFVVLGGTQWKTTTPALINDEAPAFRASTTQGEIDSSADCKGKWVIVFSHPADLTPVCTTEFMASASMMDEFKALNTELAGLSIDSMHSRIAWLRMMQAITWNGIKESEVSFPVIEDISMAVAEKNGLLTEETDHIRRAVFVDVYLIRDHCLESMRRILKLIRENRARRRTGFSFR